MADGFERVTLDPGRSQTITLRLDRSDFGFYDNNGELVVEPGTIDVSAGNRSSVKMVQSFNVTG